MCNVNCKRFMVSVLAVFAFIWGFDFVFHGYYMMDLYEATSELWRPQAEMQKYMGLMLGGQFFVAFMFCCIFTRGYEGKGIMEGVRYGFYISLLFVAHNLIMHSVAPYPTALTVSWSVGAVVMFVLAGVVLAAIYRPKSA